MSQFDVAQIRRALGTPAEPLRPTSDGKYAAVAAVLRAGKLGAEVLLIRRAEHEHDPWSGHMAFPGGRFDPGDPDLLHTAIRETREEVGLDLSENATLLGPLEPLPAIARGRRIGITIAPFVFALERHVELSPNHEVEETLWADLGRLASGDIASIVRYRLDEEVLELPAWDVDGRIVWGLTYRMLQTLLDRVASAG